MTLERRPTRLLPSEAVEEIQPEQATAFGLDSEVQLGAMRYRLEKELGKGYSGRVYKAIADDGTTVALKISHSALEAGDNDYRSHFERERIILQAIHQLKHASLPAYFGSAELDDQMIVAMEYCEGSNLLELSASQGAMSEEQLRDIICEVGGAIAHLHRLPLVVRQRLDLGDQSESQEEIEPGQQITITHQGFEGTNCVVILDIKPENILKRQDGHYVTLDFGTATPIRHFVHRTDTERQPRIYGTPPYVDPWYCRTGIPMPDSDVYSFAVTLLQLALPDGFPEGIDQEVYLKIMQREDPDLGRFLDQTTLSGELKLLLTDALSLNPEKRPADMRELLRRLPVYETEFHRIHADGLIEMNDDWEQLFPLKNQKGISELVSLTEKISSAAWSELSQLDAQRFIELLDQQDQNDYSPRQLAEISLCLTFLRTRLKNRWDAHGFDKLAGIHNLHERSKYAHQLTHESIPLPNYISTEVAHHPLFLALEALRIWFMRLQAKLPELIGNSAIPADRRAELC